MPGLVPGIHADPPAAMPNILRCITAWMAGTKGVADARLSTGYARP
jgi:hypothetical protein